MSSHRRPRRPVQPLLQWLLAGTALIAGTVALVHPGATVPATGAAATPVHVVAERGTVGTAAPPVRVRVPAMGMDSELLRLRTDSAGTLVPPEDFDRAGWFADGAVPGDVGPAVIAGHVDSRDGPAVFFRLGELVVGDEVLVDRADGTTVRFSVTATERHPKDEFPTEEIYGPTPRAELRLITCGGEFDRDRRSYRDNVVVSAVLVR